MTEFNKMKITRFYYNYLLLLCVFTSIFNWFNGDLFSFFRLLLLLFVPLPAIWRNARRKEEKLPAGQFLPLVLTGFFLIPATMEKERIVNTTLCCCLFAVSLFLYFANKYLRGRYTILHCNPSVSEETTRRAGRMQRKPLFQMFLIGAVALVFFIFLTMMLPEMGYHSSDRRSNRERQEQDNTREIKPDTNRSEMQRRVQEEQDKAADNFWLQLLRYVITFAIVVAGIVAVVYAVFRLILYLLGYRRKLVYEYEEQMDEKTDLEEITRLIPVVKRAVSFPDGWDGKIRRAFYESVRKGAGRKSVDRGLTPMELQRQYMSGTERDECLTALYEKARYAEDSISREEWGTWIGISQNKR